MAGDRGRRGAKRARQLAWDPWADPAPIRSEILSGERFERRAVSLADAQTVVEGGPRVVSLLQRLDEDARARPRTPAQRPSPAGHEERRAE